MYEEFIFGIQEPIILTSVISISLIGPPCDEPRVSVNEVSGFQSWNYILSKLFDLRYIMCTALTKLGQPYLPSIPVIDFFQMLHDFIRISLIVVCGYIVYSAPKGLTNLEWGVIIDIAYFIYCF